MSTQPAASLARTHGPQHQQQLPTAAALAAVAGSCSYRSSNSDKSHKRKTYSRPAWNNSSDLVTVAGLLAAATIASATSNSQQNSPPSYCDKSSAAPQHTGGPPGAAEKSPKKLYPILSKAEVAKHTSKDAGGVWVTYEGGVYDITEFIASHPGGASRISMAAGGALEPFWKLYELHKKEEVSQSMEGWSGGWALWLEYNNGVQ